MACRLLLGVAWFLISTTNAFATDWYVDAAAGSNANTGTSPASPWKTISYAFANVPSSGTQTIHVAPGTYDAALGESFQWFWRPSLSLVGDQGAAVTQLTLSFGNAIVMASQQSGAGYTFGNDTVISGLTIQGGATAIALSSNWNQVSPILRDLEIRSCSGAGISVSTFTQFQGGAAQPILERVHIANCGTGLSIDGTGSGPNLVTATDCSFTASTGIGVAISAYRTLSVLLERCRVEGSAGWGVQLGGGNFGSIDAVLRHTLIAHNNGGIHAAIGALYFAAFVRPTQCTIADNGVIGVRAEDGTQSHTVADLDSTIVHGHTSDLQIANLASGGSSVKYCEIGDGQQAGTNGNFQANPLFVNAPAGDYRLQAGSPCIDTGNPALAPDPDGTRADVGAFPFVHGVAIYCTAKVNSCGGTPAISGVGTPSASASSGWTVSTTGARSGKPGLLLYSTAGRAATPFSGGTLCVAAPVRRSVTLIDTVGTPLACDGVLTLDVNAFAAGALGGHPSPALRVPGTVVDCQFWGRDTVAQSLLSDALEYQVFQ